MEFSAEKCHVIIFLKSVKRPDWDYQLGSNSLEEYDKEKDHINEEVRNTYNLFANMKVAFIHINEEMVKKVTTSFIIPALEYTAVVWNPHLKKHVKKVEKAKNSNKMGA